MFVSYAQNFEDVMLWRALGQVWEGFYVDIGAQHPIVDSVSKAFHDHGWRGIHVEPTAFYANLLREHRQNETVIQAALSSESGMLLMYEIPQSGLSTVDPEIAERHRVAGFEVRQISVPGITLGEVLSLCGGREIHWLKIDVEGFEGKVLEGWAEAGLRPWIVLVESTLPLTQVESHAEWEPSLLGRGYEFVYFDGLNRFYVSNDHSELIPAFRTGPNVFDEFSLSGTASSSFAGLLNRQVSEQRAEIEGMKREHEAAIRVERENKAELERQIAEVEAASNVLVGKRDTRERELREQLQASQQESLRLTQALATREQEHGRQLQASHEESLRLTQSLAAREQELGGQLQVSQEESLRLTQALAAREREHGRQLHVSQEESLRLTQALAAREQGLGGQLQASQAESLRLTQALAAREQELGGQLQASQAESLRLTQALAAREQELGGQLQASQEESLRLTQVLAAREQELGGQLQASQEECQKLSQTLAARELELAQELNASQQEVAHQSALACDFQRKSDACTLELSLLRASTSWRLTKPLRWLGRLVRK